MRITGKSALEKLMEGNKRYIAQRSTHPNQTIDRRKAILDGQNPFAIILGCSDSRVPPEIIFDQGLGDLFVIRVAGNVLDSKVIASVEYAVEHLGVSLLMVLGHSKCGAVSATIDGGQHSGYIGDLVETIKPAVERVRLMKGDLLENAIKSNVEMVVSQLKTSSKIIAHFLKDGNLEIVGAFYDLASGGIKVL
jgi:carbonic anhydrase